MRLLVRVAVLRCEKLPSFVTWEIPNVEELFEDDRLLIAALEERGVEAESLAWTEDGVDWDKFDVALIRSTWDYIDAPERFLSVLEEIDRSSCRLLNPVEAVRWNSDKSYLLDLEQWGVPVVPTVPAADTDPASIQALAQDRGWTTVVLKPRVGAGAADVQRVPADQVATTLARLAHDRPHQEFLVQPLVESVVSEGEWSYIYIDRQLSHALLKKPAAGDYRAHGIYGGTVELATPTPDDVRQAAAILERIPFDLLYARLDLVRVDGRLAIMELELIEPLLYFALAPEGAAELAAAAVSRLLPGRE